MTTGSLQGWRAQHLTPSPESHGSLCCHGDVTSWALRSSSKSKRTNDKKQGGEMMGKILNAETNCLKHLCQSRNGDPGHNTSVSARTISKGDPGTKGLVTLAFSECPMETSEGNYKPNSATVWTSAPRGEVEWPLLVPAAEGWYRRTPLP